MIERKRKLPEILAPAGTMEALKAAVNAGCDAVYLGGNLFSARAFAGNFDTDTLVEALHFCHLFGVRIYMTVNTLLKDGELDHLTDYMEPFYNAGLDGVIVQDVGVVRTLSQAFPDLPLHASTQMSISTEYGARFLKAQGLTRVVPARELSLAEIIEIKEHVDIEIEAFNHGAMCYAYSGKCLFSSFSGGRSGNRGRCAQPCRQCYACGEKKEYLMSMKDLCTLEELPQLMDAGIDSFKIEGRMKNPSYVAATVDAYRRARDYYLDLSANEGSWDALPEEKRRSYLAFAGRLKEQMQDIYNRGGFYGGYYFTPKGSEMLVTHRPNHIGLPIGRVSGVKGADVEITLTQEINPRDVLEIMEAGVELTSNKSGKPGDHIVLKGKELRKIKKGMWVHRTRNQNLLDQVEQDLLKRERKIKAFAKIRARVNEPLSLQISQLEDGGGISIAVSGDMVQEAANKPTDAAALLEKLGKLSGSHVELTGSCEIDENVFIPMSAFNQLRRDAVELYKQQIIAAFEERK